MKKIFLPLLLLIIISITGKAQWSTGGPFGGPIFGHVMIGNDMYVAVNGGGVFKTSDTGQTWQSMSNGITDNSIAFITYDGHYLYAASSITSAMFRSANLGLSWVKLPDVPTFPFALLGLNSVIYLGGDRGIYASADSGLTWQPTVVFDNTGYHYPHNFIAKDGNLLFTMINRVTGGGNSNYVYRLHPGTNVVDTLLRHDFHPSSTEGFPGMLLTGDTIFVSAKFDDNSAYGANGLFYSYDDGAHWDSAVSAYGNNLIVQLLGWDGSTLFTDGDNYTLAQVGTYNLTTHAFDSLSTGFPQKAYASDDIFNIGNNIFVAAGSNLYQTTNHGNSWAVLPCTGLTATPVNTVFAGGQQIYAGGNGTAYYSTNSGDSWAASASNLNYVVNDIISYNGALLASTSGYGIYKSTDNGITWNQLTLTSSYLNRFGYDGQKLYVGISGAGVYKSFNGTTWSNFGTGLPGGSIFDFVSMYGYIFGASGSPNFTGAGVYRADTATGYWQYMNTGWPSRTPLSLEKRNGTIYAGSDGLGVYASPDTGNTWVPLNHGIEMRGVNDLLAIDSGLYAATDSGIYRLPWGDTVWMNVGGNLSTSSILSLSANSNYLFAAVANGSVWQLPINNTATNINETTTINARIFPNPSSGKFILQIQNASSSEFDLKVYDAAGKIVYQKHVTGGTDLISIDGENWGSGIYYVRMVSKNESSTCKLMITNYK